MAAAPNPSVHQASAHAKACLAAATALTVAAASNSAWAAKACEARSPAHRVALVELYTSQGCSSCPPADRWLSALPQRFSPEQAVPLSLHVGYWDYIGWKDPFARREFNDRQRALAQWNKSRNVYTPGVFVQGSEMRQWPDTAEVSGFVRGVNAQPAPVSLSLQARVDGGVIDARALAVPSSPQARREGLQAVLALTQSGLRTAVQAGENKGERLANDHVVREWQAATPLDAAGLAKARWTVPAGANLNQLALVAFIQTSGDAVPLQVLRLPLSGCEGS
ncbi:MAG: DUF1223 domain-containing protein [Rubrivivax sp.]|nr:DUF1223 domain-containing protein [Rubrivivax sp.]